MKTIKLHKFVGVFFALVLGTTALFAQGYGYGYGNRGNNNLRGLCVEQISGLTEAQQTEIEEMRKSHLASMTELRDSRRATTDAIERNEIRGKMLKKVEAHRKEVRALLTEDQQKQYDLLHTFANRNFAQGRQFCRRGSVNNQTFARGGGRGHYRANIGRRGGCNFQSRGANFRRAGYGGRYCNMGYGWGYYSVPADTTDDVGGN